MPCGRRSIASRSRSWDLRASAIAASASARLRTISPISTATRRVPPASLGLGFAGRPGMRAVVVRASACLIFFGRIVGITRPTPHSQQAMFSDKCLKKWYLLPILPESAAQLSLPVWKAYSRMPRRVRLCNRRCITKSAAQNRRERSRNSQSRARLHNGCANCAIRARKFANDRQGYRSVKKARDVCCAMSVGRPRLILTHRHAATWLWVIKRMRLPRCPRPAIP